MGPNNRSSRSALIVTADVYRDAGLSELQAPGRDAEELADVLKDSAIGGFEVTVSHNRPHYEVRASLEEFFQDRRPNDVLLVHFSCHGVKDGGGRLIFAATDTNTKLLGATGVAAEFVNELVTECRSNNIVLLLDCCYSGAFARGMRARSGRTIDAAEGFHGTGRAVLSASSALEYAWEDGSFTGSSEPSVFTAAVVRGLRSGEADRDQDGLVSVDDLYRHVYDEVRRATPHQNPNLWSNVEGMLVVALNPRPPAKPLPTALQQAIDGEPWQRSGAIPELVRLARGSDQGLARSARATLERLAEDDSRQVSTSARAAMDGLGPAPTPDVSAGSAGSAARRRMAVRQARWWTPVSFEAWWRQAGTYLRPGSWLRGNRRWAAAAIVVVVAGVPAIWPWVTAQDPAPAPIPTPVPVVTTAPVAGPASVSASPVGASPSVAPAAPSPSASPRAVAQLTHREADMYPHAESVYGAAFTPNGRQVVMVANHGRWMLWDLDRPQSKTGLVNPWPYYLPNISNVDVRGEVRGVDVVGGSAPTRIVTTSKEGVGVVWEPSGPGPVTWTAGYTDYREINAAVWAGAFNADGSRLVTAGADGVARIITLDTRSVTPIDVGVQVLSVAFSSNGDEVVTGGYGGEEPVRVWSADTGTPSVTLPGVSNVQVYSVAVQPGGTAIAAATGDGKSLLWRDRTQPPQVLENHPSSATRSVAFSGNGELLATAGDDGIVRLFDVESGSKLGELPAETGDKTIHSARFSRQGLRLVTANNFGRVRVWDLIRGRP